MQPRSTRTERLIWLGIVLIYMPVAVVASAVVNMYSYLFGGKKLTTWEQ